MPQITPTIEGLHIVLIGSFNPQIFQPAWFSVEKLIRKEEADSAKIEVLHPQVASFSLEWLELRASLDRFYVSTSSDRQFHPELARDLTLGTFRILHHTPLRMLGLNHYFHFSMPSEEAWHKVGHIMAPQKPWKGLLERPGMRSLAMQGIRPDGFKGNINVFVEPSIPVHHGLFVLINDHYEVAKAEEPEGASELMNTLEKIWKESLEKSKNIAYSLVMLGE